MTDAVIGNVDVHPNSLVTEQYLSKSVLNFLGDIPKFLRTVLILENRFLDPRDFDKNPKKYI
jgi:hypothetical protein